MVGNGKESIPVFVAIASSTEHNVRYSGSSGGVVTEIIKYFFKTTRIASTISYKFSGKYLFVPYIAYNYEEYNQTGSIYHNIDIFSFLKSNIENIKSPVLVTCLPCQARGVRSILSTNNIDCYVIALVCSGQLTKDATYDFLKRNRISIHDIVSFRYRGYGWPSGITIRTKDGNTYFFDNLKSDWLYFFHSTIYNPNKCFSCSDTFGIHADVSIADPWIKRYKESETIGCSVIAIYDKEVHEIFKHMVNDASVLIHEEISIEEFHNTQRDTVIKKQRYIKNKKLIHFLRSIYKTWIYKRFFLFFPKVHGKIHNAIFSRLSKI